MHLKDYNCKIHQKVLAKSQLGLSMSDESRFRTCQKQYANMVQDSKTDEPHISTPHCNISGAVQGLMACRADGQGPCLQQMAI